jgi:murein DD-endopeptidase MepM/ murein hydrolase activator NlpD
VPELTRCVRAHIAACLLAGLILTGAEPALAQTAAPIPNSGGTSSTSPPAPKSQPAPSKQAVQRPIDPPPAPVRVPTSGYVFPVRGTHSFGTADNAFGAPRAGHTHQGHDVLAPVGTLLVAARGGRVSQRAFQGAAGHYVVIQTNDGFDHVYMHLQAPAIVTVGQVVRAGQPIGRVGCTGTCSGAHLHFEVWAGRWYAGGHPVDPLPYLRAWDAIS